MQGFFVEKVLLRALFTNNKKGDIMKLTKLFITIYKKSQRGDSYEFYGDSKCKAILP
jgi:hypothetical protein